MGDERSPWTAEEYARLAGFSGDWRDSWWNTDYLRLLGRRLRLEETHSVLDVGCGVGHWGQRILPLCAWDAKLAGIDIEESFVDQAIERAVKRGIPEPDYRSSPVEELPFADDSFDLVTCQTVLIHVGDARVALQEMLRVTKAGGLILVAEPNNMACSLVQLMMSPRPAWPEIEAVLRFQAVCEEGKKALGRGDSSVGDRVPGLLADLGVRDVRVSTNDRSPALFPPYDADPVDLKTWRTVFENEGWPVGPQENAKELFLAGGGDEPGFQQGWAAATACQRRWLENLDAGLLHGGRGFVMYLVSGRKTKEGTADLRA